MEKVLLLYNDFEYGDPAFHESRVGVLDQVRAVADSLDKLAVQFEVLPVASLSKLTDLLKGRSERLIFNLMEEFAGSIRDAAIMPALCESFGFGYTGNGTEALFLAQDKSRAKAILAGAGLPCPAGVSVPPGQTLSQQKLKSGLYIIKPACCDASEGIEAESVVTIPSDKADARVRWIHKQFSQAAVVEQFIPSRELNVSVIETDDGAKVLPLAEIDFSAFPANQVRIVDYRAKWVKESFGYNNTPRLIPAPLAEPVAEKIRRLAIQAWQAMECSGYSRVDFRLDESDSPYVLEVNPNPDISPDAGFAAAINAAGIAYEEFVLLMLENAVRRRDIQVTVS